jgi:hypothetical protein
MTFPTEAKWLAFGCAVIGAHLIALAAWPLLTLPGRARYASLSGAALLVLLTPLTIPTDAPFPRFLAGCAAFFVAARMIDFVRVRTRDGRQALGLASYTGLLFHPSAITVEASRRRLPSNRPAVPDLSRLAVGSVFLSLGIWLMLALFLHQPFESSFLLDHTVKLLGLLLCVESFSMMWHGLMRLFGLDVLPVSDFCFLSLSPTEVWRRYNTIVGAWLRENVYIPAGGKPNRARAVLLTFAVSGIVHEYAFGIGIGRLTGYQMAFFMIQGLGVAYLGSPRESGVPILTSQRFLAWAATMSFMLLTSIFFLASFGQVLPSFYAAQPWLP